MPSEMKNTSKNTVMVIILAIVLTGSGYLCYTTFGDKIMEILPWGNTSSTINAPQSPIVPQQAPVSKEEATPKTKVATPTLAAPSERGSVQALTEYRAELDALEMGIKIETARGKLKQIQRKNESANILDLLPQPTTPPVQTSVSIPLAPPEILNKTEEKTHEPHIIAVGGIGADLVAMVRGTHGIQHVRVGDTFEDGIVSSISRERVALKKDGKTMYFYFIQ